MTGTGSADARSSTRHKILHRTRGTNADGIAITLILVDISTGGFMARTEAALAEGDRLTVDLPIVGHVAAEVRWALGGRIGCRFVTPVGADDHAAMLEILPPDRQD